MATIESSSSDWAHLWTAFDTVVANDPPEERSLREAAASISERFHSNITAYEIQLRDAINIMERAQDVILSTARHQLQFAANTDVLYTTDIAFAAEHIAALQMAEDAVTATLTFVRECAVYIRAYLSGLVSAPQALQALGLLEASLAVDSSCLQHVLVYFKRCKTLCKPVTFRLTRNRGGGGGTSPSHDGFRVVILTGS